MGRSARASGAVETVITAEAQTLNQFVGGVCEEWFSSQSAFLACIVFAKLKVPEHLEDSLTLRALLIMMSSGLVNTLAECPECKAATKLH